MKLKLCRQRSRRLRPQIERQLEQARSELSVSQATEERITSELKALKESGKATPEMVKDYEIYLSRVQSMVAENQKIVEEMEKAYARHQGTEKTGGSSKSPPSAEVLLPQQRPRGKSPANWVPWTGNSAHHSLSLTRCC